MAEARVARPKGITKIEWDDFINKLGDYRSLDPADPDYQIHLAAQSEEISDLTVALFLEPITS